MKKLFSLIFLFVVLVGFSAAHTAVYKSNEESTTISEPVNDDAFVAGNSIAVTAPIHGELFAAGNTLAIKNKIERSIFAAGNSITIDAGSGYNTYVAGNSIVLSGEYGHDVYATGSTVTISQMTIIHGNLNVAGATLILKGKVDGDIYASGNKIDSAADINGTFKVQGETITFSGGTIGKDLTYKSNRDATGLDKVQIKGKTERSNLPTKTEPTKQLILWKVLTSLIVGAAILFLLPQKVAAVTQTVKDSWAPSLGYGVLTFIVAPIVAAILMVTLVGLPLGVIGLVIYAISLYVAAMLSVVVVGDWLMGRFKAKRNWWLALLVGAVVITGLGLVPIVGPIVRLAFFVGVVLPVFGASVLWWKGLVTKK